jgi:Trm5-related predicted tRNA methylase
LIPNGSNGLPEQRVGELNIVQGQKQRRIKAGKIRRQTQEKRDPRDSRTRKNIKQQNPKPPRKPVGERFNFHHKELQKRTLKEQTCTAADKVPPFCNKMFLRISYLLMSIYRCPLVIHF